MQRNVSKGAPDWVRTVAVWSYGAHREVHQVLCDDRRTLLWLANQRAVEFHVPFLRAGAEAEPTGLVLDLDPPEGRRLRAGRARWRGLVRQALADSGLAGAVKTSGVQGAARRRPGARVRRGGRRRGHPCAGRPDRARSTPSWRPPPTSRRTGTAGCSSTPPAAGPARSWPPTARGSARACRCRCRWRGTPGLGPPRRGHRDQRGAPPGRRRPVGGAAAGAAGAAGRPGRRGAHHPGRAGAGDARGQAASQGAAGRAEG